MKKDQLKELLEKYTKDGETDFEAFSLAVNENINILKGTELDKNKGKETLAFLKEHGYENTEAFTKSIAEKKKANQTAEEKNQELQANYNKLEKDYKKISRIGGLRDKGIDKKFLNFVEYQMSNVDDTEYDAKVDEYLKDNPQYNITDAPKESEPVKIGGNKDNGKAKSSDPIREAFKKTEFYRK